MAKKKKTPSTKKATARKATSTTRKASPRKKTTTTKSAKTKKPSNRPAGPREDALASTALKLVDQAAAMLRQGIRTSAGISQDARRQTRERAHGLLNQATSALDRLISRL